MAMDRAFDYIIVTIGTIGIGLSVVVVAFIFLLVIVYSAVSIIAELSLKKG